MSNPDHIMMTVSKALQDIAQQLDTYLEDAAGERVSFSLIVFTNPRFQYISNTKDRAEIAGALQALIDGWKKNMPDIPAHEVRG